MLIGVSHSVEDPGLTRLFSRAFEGIRLVIFFRITASRLVEDIQYTDH